MLIINVIELPLSHSISCSLCPSPLSQVFFAVAIGSFSLGNALPELETFATALGSASAVYEIIDKVGVARGKYMYNDTRINTSLLPFNSAIRN